MEKKKNEAVEAFRELLDIMDELREKCPWDQKQTWESLRTLTIEETYELADAVLAGDSEGIREELGDLLLHVVFYAKIGAEKEAFEITDIIRKINRKLIHRHPHIFGDVKVTNAREVADNWEKIKLEEGDQKTVLGGIPSSLPALIKAYRVQDKAGGVGFDWKDPEGVWDKVDEELGEVKEVLLTDGTTEKLEEEFGDLLFTIVNAARLYHVNPENVLEKANLKFIRRFNFLEQETLKKGISLKQLTIEEMDRYWEQAKKNES
ncbi:MAG: nucleoside triphosphate pyrophosphohydrolase [Bacteroidales bacterium]|nr:nucleoside triphosphate pyrophosphohydrolase [Bacteroidales bacterium]